MRCPGGRLTWGIGSGWRWRRSIKMTGGPGGEAPWLARGPPKAGLAANFLIKQYYSQNIKILHIYIIT